jgi:2-methylcitrate dehydratase PrpD
VRNAGRRGCRGPFPRSRRSGDRPRDRYRGELGQRLAEANRSGGDIKQFQSGWAAKSAIQAAQLARLGVTGPELALEGRYGFFQCFAGGTFDAEVLVGGLGWRWQLLEQLRFKPYPSNYYTHAGIDAALALRRNGLAADQVDSVRVVMAAAMMHTVGEPIERKQHPRSAYEAKFSVPYTFASALLGGAGLGLGLSDFTDALVAEPRRGVLHGAHRRCHGPSL